MKKSTHSNARALLASVAVAALLSACSTPGAAPQQQAMNAVPSQSELAKATSYWAGKFNANPGNAEAALNYASNLKALGKSDSAFVALKTAHTYNPKHARLSSELGRMALAQNKPRLAQKVLKHAYDPLKPDWRAVSAQGTAEAQLGNYKAAQAHFKKALDLSPNQPSVMNNLALAHALDGNAQEAEGLLRKASDKGSSNPKVKQNLALVLGLQGRFKEAETVSSTSQLQSDKVADNMSYLRRMVKAMPADEEDATVVADVPAAFGGGVPAAPAANTTATAPGAPLSITPPKALANAAQPAADQAPLRGTNKVAQPAASGWGSTVNVASSGAVSEPISE